MKLVTLARGSAVAVLVVMGFAAEARTPKTEEFPILPETTPIECAPVQGTYQRGTCARDRGGPASITFEQYNCLEGELDGRHFWMGGETVLSEMRPGMPQIPSFGIGGAFHGGRYETRLSGLWNTEGTVLTARTVEDIRQKMVRNDGTPMDMNAVTTTQLVFAIKGGIATLQRTARMQATATGEPDQTDTDECTYTRVDRPTDKYPAR